MSVRGADTLTTPPPGGASRQEEVGSSTPSLGVKTTPVAAAVGHLGQSPLSAAAAAQRETPDFESPASPGAYWHDTGSVDPQARPDPDPFIEAMETEVLQLQLALAKRKEAKAKQARAASESQCQA